MKVLFVCEGNINRSQMAAVFLRKMLPKVEVSSAGTLVPKDLAGKPVSAASARGIECMKKIGYDMSGCVITRLTPEMVEDADVIILVGPTPGGPLPRFLLNSPRLQKWNVPDPGWGHCTVEAARDMILENVAAFAETQKSKRRK